MIHQFRAEGLSIRAIALRAGAHRHTVRKALKMKHPPSRSGRRRGGIIDPYRGWLMAKLQQYPELSVEHRGRTFVNRSLEIECNDFLE